jgi:hypothetical protein
MSRSRKKTPKLGFSSCASDKQDKVLRHRHTRRGNRQGLQAGDDGEAPQAEHKRSGTWNFAKDGKRWVKNPRARDMRK